MAEISIRLQFPVQECVSMACSIRICFRESAVPSPLCTGGITQMNYKKVLSIVLGCLLFIETPFSAQAVSLSSVISPKTNIVGEQSVSDKIEPSEGDSPS